jgi:two-component system chemotaxis response regulator CheB
MLKRDIIVIGASAGGVEALVTLVRGLPADLLAAVFIVLHVPAHGTSALPSILNRAGTLQAGYPSDGQKFQQGRIYVAPPDHHLLLKDGTVRVTRGPRENGHRPAADALFRTAARTYGRRVIGVVLSGALDDGTAGLMAIKSLGGVAVVQDPGEALYPSMPSNARDQVAVDHCLPVAQIAALLARLVNEPVEEPAGADPVNPDLSQEADMAELEVAAMQDQHRSGTPSAFGCPECGGVLWELHDEQQLHFRCRVGHAWSPDSLLAKQADALEAALWTALRALEESVGLSLRLARQAEQRGYSRASARFREQSRSAEEHALVIRKVLLSHTNPPEPESVEENKDKRDEPQPQSG